jgi:hypothetical protein
VSQLAISYSPPRRVKAEGVVRQRGAFLGPVPAAKERYYEVLEQSSARWHEGKHDPWPTLK